MILNLKEILLFNIGINAFSCIITCIILCSLRKDFADSYEIRLLQKAVTTILLVLLSDITMWTLNGRSTDFLRILNYTNTILYFIMQLAVVYWWIRYAWYRLFNRKMPKKKENLFILFPFLLLSLIVLTSPLTGWCFYFDRDNYYHRGILSMPMAILILLYLFFITTASLLQYKKERITDRKKELLIIAFFTFPAFLGGFLQMVFYGFSIVWPCVVITSLLVLLNKESHAISQDALTGLNNRRSMEKLLSTYEDNRAVTLIMLDINDFKNINDKYGHSLGDLALIKTADILRTSFNETSAFLARYAGDEFVVILPDGKEATAIEAVEKIKSNFELFSKTNHFPFRLSVSVGYAISTEKSEKKIEKLLKEADDDMYRNKVLHHRKKSEVLICQ